MQKRSRKDVLHLTECIFDNKCIFDIQNSGVKQAGGLDACLIILLCFIDSQAFISVEFNKKGHLFFFFLDGFVFIWTSTGGMLSIEISLDFENSRILLWKTRSDPLLIMGMMVLQQFIEGNVLQIASTAGWNAAVKHKNKERREKNLFV